MAGIEAKCQAIAALLQVGKTPTVITKEVSCSRFLVYKVKNLQKAGKDLGYAYTPRVKTVLTPTVRAGIKRPIKAAPTKPLRRVAREAGVHREAVWRVIKDEGWRSLRRVKVPLISAEGQKKCCLLYTSPSPRD